MDFLNKAFAQVRELFASMTPGSRITAGLLVAVVVISLAYLVMYGVSGPSTYLMDGTAFSPAELDMMEAAFAKAGLGDYVREGGRVRVPRSKQIAYVAALADANALPNEIGDILDKALRDTNPFQTKEQQQGIVAAGKQRMVSQIISSMTGIENAWVMYDAQSKGGLRREEIKKATVFVKPRGGQNLEARIANSIRKMMPWAGLDPKNVAVADLNSGKTFYGDEESGSADFDPYIDRKRIHEQEFRSKILESLAYVPGVNVNCNVELSEERLNRQEEIKHDPKPVAAQVTETNRSRTQDGAAGGGPVGYQAQGSNARMSLGGSQGKGSHEEEEESERQEVNLVSSTRKEVETVPMAIKRVTASVVVPESYFSKVWGERNPGEAGQPAKTPTAADLDQIRKTETDKIQACVAALLPRPAGVADPLQLVSVTVFQDLKLAAIPTSPWQERALAWLAQSWRTLGMIGLALVSLVMLRSMVRMSPAVEGAPTPVSAAKTEEKKEEKETAQEGKRERRFQGSGESLLDELSDLVASDPDTAANILRNWIGNVG